METVNLKSAILSNEEKNELLLAAKKAFAAKYPEPTTRKVGDPLPDKKIIPVEVEYTDAEIIEAIDEDNEIEIVEVVPVKGKKVIPQNSLQAQKLIAKAEEVKEVPAPIIVPEKKKLSEMNPDEKKAYYNALSAKALAAKKAKNENAPAPVATSPINPLSNKVVTTPAPASVNTVKGNTPLSKMTIEELNGVKGTISDIQWNKYYKMACKKDGVEPTKATRTINPVKEVKEVQATPVKEVKEVLKVIPVIELLRGHLEPIKDAEQEVLDNTPENLQSSEKYSKTEDAINALEDILSMLDDIVTSLEDITQN